MEERRTGFRRTYPDIPMLSNERGMAIPIVLAVILLVGLGGAGLVLYSTKGAESTVDRETEQVAQEYAESGIETAKAQLNEYPDPALYDGSGQESKWSEKKGGQQLRLGQRSNYAIVSIRSIDDRYEIKSQGVSGMSVRKLVADATVGRTKDPPTLLPGRPQAIDDTAVTEQSQAVEVNVLVNDLRARDDKGNEPGATLLIDGFEQPEHGTVECDSVCTYTPDRAFKGKDMFSYSATDGSSSSSATVTITVRALSDPPTRLPSPSRLDAQPDTEKVDEGDTVRFNVLLNDRPKGQRSTFSLIGKTKPDNGSVACLSNGVCEYRPDRGSSRNDSFVYEMKNDNRDTSKAKVSIDLIPAPRLSPPPTAVSQCLRKPGAEGAVGRERLRAILNGEMNGKIINSESWSGNVTGTPGDDVIYMRGSSGNISGGGGDDVIIYAGSNASNLKGSSGNDLFCLFDAKGNIDMGTGNDVLHVGTFSGNLNVGSGDDSLYAQGNGNFDVGDGKPGDKLILSGNGAFNCDYDRGDEIRGC